MIKKGKKLFDKDSKLYTVVEITGRITVLYHHGSKEFVITRPLQISSEGLVILEGPGVWWVWTYDDAIKLIEYIKHNG